MQIEDDNNGSFVGRARSAASSIDASQPVSSTKEGIRRPEQVLRYQRHVCRERIVVWQLLPASVVISTLDSSIPAGTNLKTEMI
jgi:hypothetical protein